jgi:hypothetical protein
VDYACTSSAACVASLGFRSQMNCIATLSMVSGRTGLHWEEAVAGTEYLVKDPHLTSTDVRISWQPHEGYKHLCSR